MRDSLEAVDAFLKGTRLGVQALNDAGEQLVEAVWVETKKLQAGVIDDPVNDLRTSTGETSERPR